jgi:hypothetical protein
VGDEGGGFVGGGAAVFLEPLLFINALGTEAFQEIFAGFVATRFFVDALDDALFDGFLDGNGVEGPVGAESELMVGS